MHPLLRVALLMSCAYSPYAYGQCPDRGTTSWYGTAYAVRLAGTAVTYTQAYASGPNSQYASTTVAQTDTFTPKVGATVRFGSLSTSTGPGQVAQVSRSTNINNLNNGFFTGTFNTVGYVSGYRSCDGLIVPPYGNGSGPYTNTASLTLTQPTVFPSGLSALYVNTFLAYNGGGPVPTYSNSAILTAIHNDPTLTASWTFSGNTATVNVSCTSCNFPQITAVASATGGCFANGVTASYVVDGLQSTATHIAVLAPVQQPYRATRHVAVAGGYDSYYDYQIVDTCGNPMPYVHMSEAFPNGFLKTAQAYNWNPPVANSWDASAIGEFVDDIGFNDTSGLAVPTPLAPATPLGTLAVYFGTQYINVGPHQVYNGVQIHYQDHGGYQ